MTDFIWKIIMTVVIVLVGAAAGAAIPNLFNAIFNAGDTDIWKWVITVILSVVAVLPAWYIWKGTKLIPFVTNFAVRILIMLVIFLVLPFLGGFNLFDGWVWVISTIDIVAIIGFGLIGVWLK